MNAARSPFAVVVGLIGILCVAYWEAVSSMVGRWNSDPQYSHGYLIPAVAIALLWMRRGSLRSDRVRPAAWGLALIAAGLVIRHVSTHFYLSWFEQLSLVPCLMGVVVIISGSEGLRWAWSSIAFLAFMAPLPFAVETALRDPLRTIATETSTFALQTLGVPAVTEGHVIVVDSVRLGVAEACSGLRMLMVFVALATAAALSTHGPLWERACIAMSAIPIAIVSNTLRISATGVLYAAGYDRFAEFVFHDVAGWLMIPVALCMLSVELSCLRRVFLDEEARPVAGLSNAGPAGGRRPVAV